MEHPFDGFNSNDRDSARTLCCSTLMTRPSPPPGRCFTPTGFHALSGRRLPARAPTLPSERDTTTDDLLPACTIRRPDEPLRRTRLEGSRYQSFVRKISEEVVLQEEDARIEPRARKA